MADSPPLPSATAIPWHSVPAAEVLSRLDSTPAGLTSAEADTRLRRLGPNLFATIRPTPALTILVRQFTGPLVVLLAAAAGISLWSGDVADALAILAVLLLNALIGFTTEWRARRAMEGLLALEVGRARVLRDGTMQDLSAREIVPGDIIELEAGQQVPADGRLVLASDLQVVEAALTGESEPVSKKVEALPAPTPLPSRVNLVFKATGVVRGRGRAVVVATGMSTEVGRIGAAAGALGEERTPLERRLAALGRPLMVIALAATALVSVVAAFNGVPLAQVLQTAIALAVAAVPEGLPAVATITLAVGVRRMARRNALVRRLPAVETLGSASVVCTDKTGTLTTGVMTLTEMQLDGRRLTVTGAGINPLGAFLLNGEPVDPGEDRRVIDALRIGALANRAELTLRPAGWEAVGDPTETALLVAARKAGLDPATLRMEWPETGEIPFSSERMLMATFHAGPDGSSVCVKGAPARILRRCGRIRTAAGTQPLDPTSLAGIHARNAELASRGLRVLALAEGRCEPDGEEALKDLTFVALVGLTDPPAAGVAATLDLIREAGIRTVMLTGDQAGTAAAVGAQLGLLGPDGAVIGGEEVDRLSDEELDGRAAIVGVYSRLSPEAKLRLIASLQRRGEVVAMLGDGVNDAAALRKADIGVAMGQRGTDLAKEAAEIILVDDRFATVAAAVEEGRVIYANVRKAVHYLVACNIAELLVVLAAVLVGLPPPLYPLQILWLNLLTDGAPALALALEPGEPGVMQQPPRRPGDRLLGARDARPLAGYAVLIAGVTLLAFTWALQRPGGGERAATLAFTTLALAQILHLGNARRAGPVLSWPHVLANSGALVAAVGTIMLQVLAVEWSPLAQVLRVTPLTGVEWLVVACLAVLPAVAGQAGKLLEARHVKRHG